jgi:hypothetical protein
MLYHLANAKDDKQFQAIVAAIDNALWPESLYISKKNSLPKWDTPPDAMMRLKKIRECENIITKEILSTERLYALFNENVLEPKKHLSLPFIERYHQYFLERQWEYPYRDPQLQYANLFRLHQPSPEDEAKLVGESKAYVNYSSNYGDYCHFRNVIVATARLIQYFSDTTITQGILTYTNKKYSNEEQEFIKFVSEQLSYKSIPSLRTFKLLLAAFYHDIGKTVDYHRHGMEGAIILASHTTQAVNEIKQIVDTYRELHKITNKNFEFDRDDLLFISNLIFYHDQYGMLGTGEAGYLRLAELIHRVQRHTLTTDLEKQRERGRRYLFDLWVLNLADIMVSLDGRKSECQKDLLYEDSATNRIRLFLDQDKALALRHDLRLSLDLLDLQNQSQHSDDLTVIEERALDYAKRHVIERIRRLLRTLIVDHMKEYCLEFGDSSKAAQILQEISLFSISKWNSVISRSIYSIGDYGEFSKRFCWIGQMDYSFGFFYKIALRALYHVNSELGASYGSTGFTTSEEAAPRCGTGWVYQPDTNSSQSILNNKFIMRTNAEFFVDNFTSTLVQILHHILFREKDVSRLRNLEFWVATQRLTDEKIDRIISLEGPYRTHRSVQLALESIFIW